ncbi:MAG TPA: ABC transporter permease [Gemmatimonadales bacterium]|nr:ABC transporter permease [Gemmatimonadales bacterium]
MLSDFRFAFRGLLRTPGFTIAALLTLALGIGANAAMFAVANAVLFRELPYPVADRMVSLTDVSVGKTSEALAEGTDFGVSIAGFLDWEKRNRTLEQLAAYRFTLFSITETGSPEAILGAMVTWDFFATSGTPPRLGRAFLESEDVPNPPKVVIVNDRIWKQRLGGRADAIGSSLQIAGQTYTVVGVLPPDYEFPGVIPSSASIDVRTVEMYTPLQTDPLPLTRDNHNLMSIGLIKAGTTLAQVRQDFDRIGRELAAEFPSDNTALRVAVTPLKERWVSHVRPALLVLLGAIGCVLLVACANVANLILARGRGRERELAVRTALGATPGRLARQLLVENLTLAFLGGAAGLFIAWAAINGVVWLRPENLPRASQIRLDAVAVIATFGLSLVTAALTGLAPMLRGAGMTRRDAFAEGQRGSSSAGMSRARQALTVIEVAMSLALLVGAGLLARSFERLSRVQMGFTGDSVMSVGILLPVQRYDSPEKWGRFYQTVLQQLQADPSVISAAAINVLPLSGFGETASFGIEGRAPFAQGEEPSSASRFASVDYLETTGIPLIAGRWLEPQDDSGARTIVVSQSIARDFFPDGAVGRQLRMYQHVWQVVGVVADVREFGPASDAPYQTYLPLMRNPTPYGFFVARTRLDDPAAGRVLQNAVLAADPEQPVFNVRSLRSYIASSLGPRRFTAIMMGVFAAVSLALASVGLYGVIAYLVSQRTREIGIRVALGASTSGVLRLVLGQGMRLAGIGVVIGLVLTFALSRSLSSLLVGVSVFDPLVYTLVAVTLLLVAAAATIIPARRAARVDPVSALRSE